MRTTLALVMLALLAAPSAWAIPILCGETKEGILSGGEIGYTFHAEGTPEVPEAVLIGVSNYPSYDECWKLIDPDGMQVGANKCSEPVTAGATENRSLTKTGTYTILVYENFNDQTGPFAVSLDAVSEKADGEYNGPPMPACRRGNDGTRPIQCGQTLSGTFDVLGDVDSFTFAAESLAAASISVSSESGFDPCWRLFDPTGTPVKNASNATLFCETSAVLPLPVPNGAYTVVVYESFGDVVGTYSVSVNFLGQPCPCGNGTVEPSKGEACDFSAPASGCCTAGCAIASAGTTCRTAVGACDIAETCDGNAVACPADLVASSATVCRSAADVCDLTETCTGSSPTCPPDVKSTAVCRSAVSACDAPETCNGTSNTCPADALSPSGTVCRSAAGDCDVAERCSGSSGTCPGDALAPSGSVCRAAAGACDLAEACAGGSAACPADVVRSTATVCRSAAGVCDVAETCDGANPSCPADGFAPSSTPCRSSAGVCDGAESCTGSAAACPADTRLPSGTVCRSAGGVCDAAETCSGTSATCPADVLASSATVCRSAVGACDVAETCTGSSATCPADVLRGSGTVCRAAAGVCDMAETCTGGSAACPANVTAPNGTGCDDGLFCTENDHCTAGACGGTARICNDDDACTTDQCDEALDQCSASANSCDDVNPCTTDACVGGGACTHTPRTGEPCGADPCTVGRTCQADSSCAGGTPKDCSALDDACSRGVCNPANGACVAQPIDDSAECTGACLVPPDPKRCPGCELTCENLCAERSTDQCGLGVPTKGKPPIIVIVVIGTPGERCRIVVKTSSENHAPTVLRAKPARVRGGAKAKRIGDDGRIEMPTKLKLNPVARKLLDRGESLDARIEITIGPKGSKPTLTRLVRLVKRGL